MEAVRQLYVYLDGELTEERRNQISLHLDECSPCAQAAGFEAELRAIISSRCKDRVPDSLVSRVAAAIAAEAARQRDHGAPSAPTAGTPTAGTPTEGTPTEGTPTEGTPTEGTPTAGTPTAGTPTEGTA
jgi:mycothiol system anti-sigma-R factor